MVPRLWAGSRSSAVLAIGVLDSNGGCRREIGLATTKARRGPKGWPLFGERKMTWCNSGVVHFQQVKNII